MFVRGVPLDASLQRYADYKRISWVWFSRVEFLASDAQATGFCLDTDVNCIAIGDSNVL